MKYEFITIINKARNTLIPAYGLCSRMTFSLFLLITRAAQNHLQLPGHALQALASIPLHICFPLPVKVFHLLPPNTPPASLYPNSCKLSLVPLFCVLCLPMLTSLIAIAVLYFNCELPDLLSVHHHIPMI